MLQKWCIDDIKMGFWNEKEAKRLFQELPLYNALIEKPRIKHLWGIKYCEYITSI